MDFTRKRHPRQRFDASASFVWLRRVLWNGKQAEVGSPVPSGLSRHKLRSLWESRQIQLADSGMGQAPTEQPPDYSVADDLMLSVKGRGRYLLSVRSGSQVDEFSCHGKKALMDLAASIGLLDRVEPLVGGLADFGVDTISEQEVRPDTSRSVDGGDAVGEAGVSPASRGDEIREALDKILDDLDMG